MYGGNLASMPVEERRREPAAGRRPGLSRLLRVRGLRRSRPADDGHARRRATRPGPATTCRSFRLVVGSPHPAVRASRPPRSARSMSLSCQASSSSRASTWPPRSSPLAAEIEAIRAPRGGRRHRLHLCRCVPARRGRDSSTAALRPPGSSPTNWLDVTGRPGSDPSVWSSPTAGHDDRGLQRHVRLRAGPDPPAQRCRTWHGQPRGSRSSTTPDPPRLHTSTSTSCRPRARILPQRHTPARPTPRDRYDLAALSETFKVSTRTLLRRFADETGETPLELPAAVEDPSRPPPA